MMRLPRLRFYIQCAVIYSISVIHLSAAHAGDKIGNGGAIWACQNAQSDFLGGMLLDLFEATHEFGYTVQTFPISDANQISDAVMARYLKDWPEFALKVKPHMSAVLANTRFVDAIVEKIDDANPPISPLPNQCKGGLWSFVQIANYKTDGQLLIRKDLWENAALGSVDKAALLWHEAVYRWLRSDYDDQTSTRARKIVALAFSTLPTSQISIEVRKLLWQQPSTQPPTPAPSPFPFPFPIPFPIPGQTNPPTPVSPGPGPDLPAGRYICVMDETMRQTPYMAVAATQLDASTQVKLACKNGSYGMFCSDISLSCEALASAVSWQCESQNNFTNHLFIGKGRSRLEAEYIAELTCTGASHNQESGCTSREMMKCDAF